MKRWLLQKKNNQPPNWQWTEELSISPLFLELLWNRGYSTLKELSDFLNAPLNSLTHPDDWPQIPEAAQVLANDLLAGKKLAVWGDYDVDGITATALVLEILEFHGFEILHHLPDRRSEGYGLNVENIEELAKAGCQTLLTVDCGISDVEAIARARQLGINVIVSDHHLPPAELPDAAAFVDPRMPQDKAWPCEFLSGVGVAFYLMACVNNLLAKQTGKRFRMDNVLDLVSLGTLADIMPLKGENRILAKGGLSAIGKGARPAIRALKLVSGFELEDTVNSIQAVFRLAPRINAAGRMGHPQMALDLLRETDPHRALGLAEQLNACNSQRKSEEERIHKEARKQALELLEDKNYSGLVLYGEDWHPGIIGIVASRITEEFHRPAIVLCQDEKNLKGSGRTWLDFDLHESLKACSAHLISFGGHKQAAGVRLALEKLEDFRKAFSEEAARKLGPVPQQPVLTIERELSFTDASNLEFIRELELLEPYGPGNPEPVFVSSPLLVRKRSFLGSSGEHILLELEEVSSGIVMSAKAWRMAKDIPESLVNQPIRIAFTPQIDTFRGFARIDLGLKDWQKI